VRKYFLRALIGGLLLAGPGAVGLCAADFATDVYPALKKAGCADCHNPDGVASGTRLKFPERDASNAAINAFGRSLRSLIDPANPEKSVLLSKPTLRVAHAGGKRIEPGTPTEEVLRRWIEELAKSNDTGPAVEVAEAVKPVGPVLRRLTHSQYNNTVRDLLGDDSRIADTFPPEDFVNGFRNQYQAQNTSPLLAEAYAVAAEKLTKKALAGTAASRFIPCKPKSAVDAACRDQFITTFGRRAFRRRLLPEEVDRYRALFNSGAQAGKDFYEGVRSVMEAMLQSPNFLLRVENGLDPAFRAYETASRLSYALWNTMPDEELLRAAESGELNTPAGVERAARRMLKDPRAKQAMDEFLAEWLRFDSLLSTIKDRRTYPQFTPELALSMAEETRRLFSHLVWNDQNFMEFYSADYGFLSSDLAALYGVNRPSQEFEKVTFPAATERAGVLGQATFLTLTSKPAETSPTARGLFIRERFLCQDVPQPPPGVNANLPPLAREKPRTNRERLGIHLSNASCASCHTLIDPIGFGFEKFDAIGQRREKQKLVFQAARGEKETEPLIVELDLDTSGYVAGIPDSAFSSPRELGKILAGNAQCQECVAKQLFRYMAGRHETPADRVLIRKAFERFRSSGFRFQELLVSLSSLLVFPEGVDNAVRSD
jgi:Protein of unknown function (DUF1587)./Protein of unknown function (DUF1592)./Protein of unknown function (DUF1595)./Protein of unknown function (DUF1588)./Protein of unknown function (DUF1585).